MNILKIQKYSYLATVICLGIISIILVGVFSKIYIYDTYKTKENCKEIIKEKLISPSSAIFSNYKEGKYGLIYYDVDSQNKFGAMIRSKRECMKKINGNKIEYAKKIN